MRPSFAAVADDSRGERRFCGWLQCLVATSWRRAMEARDGRWWRRGDEWDGMTNLLGEAPNQTGRWDLGNDATQQFCIARILSQAHDVVAYEAYARWCVWWARACLQVYAAPLPRTVDG